MCRHGNALGNKDEVIQELDTIHDNNNKKKQQQQQQQQQQQ